MWAMIVGCVFVGVMSASSMASASPVTDIADGLNNTLFGGTNLYAAQIILTAAVMMAAGLALAILGMPPTGMFIILFCVLGALTAIGWADITFILVAALIAVASFGATAVSWVTGGGGGSDAGDT